MVLSGTGRQNTGGFHTMKENEKYEVIKCPHCQKDVTHIEGTDYICSYCGKSLNDQPEKESRWQKVKQYVLKNKVLVSIAACLVICVLVMSGIVSSAVNEKAHLEEQLQDQTAQYEDLQSRNDTLSAKYNKLQSNYTDLETEITNYQDQQTTIDKLNTQLAELQEKYDTLSTENESLKSRVSTLQAKSVNTSSSSGSGKSSSMNSGTSSSDAGNASGGEMVWLSATGSKYHSIPDCGNMNPNKARQVSRSSAEAQGYDACSKCW